MDEEKDLSEEQYGFFKTSVEGNFDIPEDNCLCEGVK